MNVVYDKNLIINVFVKNFIRKDKKERVYLELLSQRHRGKFTTALNHNWEKLLDMRFLSRIDKSDDSSDKIRSALGLKDDELCYVISDYKEYDDKLMPFKEVFDEIYARGFATMLVSTSGDKLFLDTEQQRGGTPRFIGVRAS